jgi:hypothetical protein
MLRQHRSVLRRSAWDERLGVFYARAFALMHKDVF